MEEDPDGLVASPLSIEADAWEQFRALYVVTVLVVWGFLLQGAILAQIVEVLPAAASPVIPNSFDCFLTQR